MTGALFCVEAYDDTGSLMGELRCYSEISTDPLVQVGLDDNHTALD
jgi:hypothetical protein